MKEKWKLIAVLIFKSRHLKRSCRENRWAYSLRRKTTWVCVQWKMASCSSWITIQIHQLPHSGCLAKSVQIKPRYECHHAPGADQGTCIWKECKETTSPRPWLWLEHTTGGRSIVYCCALAGGDWRRAPPQT